MLSDLFRRHAHLTPGEWLRRMHIRQAASDLLHTPLTIADIGESFGFGDRSAFQREFIELMRTTPEAYRALDGNREFSSLPPRGYRANEILAYQARDPESSSERSQDNRIWKALGTSDGPVILELALSSGQVAVRIHPQRSIGRDSMAGLHRAALSILGLVNNVSEFERRHRTFAAPRLGLRVPLLPTSFEALCWALIGQQINLAFASALRREMISLAGENIGDMRVHPTPEAVDNLDASELTRRRYSRSKARYLVDAAQAVVSRTLDLESLATGSAVAAEKTLLAQRGSGIWTARYVLILSGFADAAPIGDSGLATALKRLCQLPAKPNADQASAIMNRFAPHRSLASGHLWASLKDIDSVPSPISHD
jgi:AraC family transcriptional regulator, regulatory protein of adaptative response / DNA-3-methyladenine glycosylase II